MNKGGYTLVSLMLANIALASFTVPGLGKRLHSIGRKRVVLTDINIAGERMKDIGVQVDLDTETETDEETGEEIIHYKALIRDVYGYVLSVTDDTISSKQSKDPLELQEEIEELQDKTEKITQSETATEVDGTLSADVIYGTTSINSPSGAFDELEGGAITGDSIVENMTGYTFSPQHATNIIDLTPIYAGVVKNGNKLTFVWFLKFTPKNSGYSNSYAGVFGIPNDIAAKLYPSVSDYLYYGVGVALKSDLSYENLQYGIEKVGGGSQVGLVLRGLHTITQEVEYTLRVEATFLLSANLAE